MVSDRRLTRTFGMYRTREQLAAAVHELLPLTQREIGEITGVSAATISRILNGDKQLKTPTKLKDKPVPLNLNDLWRIQPTEGEIRWHKHLKRR